MYSESFIYKALVHHELGNFSFRQTSARYGTSCSTIHRWKSKYDKGKPENKRKRESGYEKKKEVSKRREAVRKCLTENPFITLDEIRKELVFQGIEVSRSTVHRCVKEIGFSRKRARHRFTRKEPTFNQCNELLENVTKVPEIVSIDETSLVLEPLPIYGYSMKGERVVKRTSKPIKGNRVSLLLAVSNTRGVLFHETRKGSYDTVSFADFLEKSGIENTTVLLDNVAFHHAKLVASVANRKGLKLLFTPPYCPDFNFVENVFSILKSKTRRFDIELRKVLESITRESISNCFRHSCQMIQNEMKKCQNIPHGPSRHDFA